VSDKQDDAPADDTRPDATRADDARPGVPQADVPQADDARLGVPQADVRRADDAQADETRVDDARVDDLLADDGRGGADPDASVEAARVSSQLRLRRAPRYGQFGLTGALIGVLAGLVLALSFTAASNYSMQTIAGYFAAILGLIGAVLALGVAVLFERRRP
jgi:hypothetical protein